MAKNKLFAWQLWAHYILLEALLVIAFGLWQMLNPTDYVVLYLVIALGDQAIHWILGATTGWKD